MWRSIQWRAGLTAAFLALSIIFLIPTLVDPLPKWWTKFLPTEKINLGLDLRGGMHLLLEVETQKAVESALDKYASEIKDVLAKKDIPARQVERTPDGKISIVLPDAKANDRFSQVRADQYGNLKVASFREQEGKFLYLLEMNPAEAKGIEESRCARAGDDPQPGGPVRRGRADHRAPGRQRNSGAAPGIKEPQRAIELIGRTALLEFKLVDEENSLEEASRGTFLRGAKFFTRRRRKETPES